MPDLREILQRFRAAGPSGPAMVAAVAADRRAVLLDEVVPVFTALAPDRVEARRRRYRTGTVAGAAHRRTGRRAGADQAADRPSGPQSIKDVLHPPRAWLWLAERTPDGLDATGPDPAALCRSRRPTPRRWPSGCAAWSTNRGSSSSAG